MVSQVRKDILRLCLTPLSNNGIIFNSQFDPVSTKKSQLSSQLGQTKTRISDLEILKINYGHQRRDFVRWSYSHGLTGVSKGPITSPKIELKKDGSFKPLIQFPLLLENKIQKSKVTMMKSEYINDFRDDKRGITGEGIVIEDDSCFTLKSPRCTLVIFI